MQSEFASLLDLVIKRGFSHSEILHSIHEAVSTAYKISYPKKPVGVRIYVDESTGDVRLLMEGRDVTPQVFVPEAARIARTVLIQALSVQPVSNTPSQQVESSLNRETRSIFSGRMKTYAANIFFFGYNGYMLLFFIIMAVSVFSTTGYGGMIEIIRNFSSVRTVLYLFALSVPCLSVASAVYFRLYDNPGKLTELFFLAELPILCILFFAGTVIAVYSPAILFGIFIVCLVPLVLYISQANVRLKDMGNKIFLCVSQSVVFVFGYFVFLYMFYVPVIFGSIVQLFFSDIFFRAGNPIMSETLSYYQPPPVSILDILVRFSIGFVAVILVSFIMTVPFLFLYKLILASREAGYRLKDVWDHRTLTTARASIGLVLLIIVAGALYPGGDEKRLQLLGSIMQKETFEDREAIAVQLQGHEESLATTLRGAVSGSGRYFYSSDSDGLAKSYVQVFGMSPGVSNIIQKMFLTAAYPFVFHGNATDGVLQSNFVYVFGHNYYENAVQDFRISNPQVLLKDRNITVLPHADIHAATITVDEEFENTGYMQSEVVYEFALPEGSAVTELRLGPDLEFAGVITPRGAGQQVYEQELQRRRDPALMEQIGPRSYRLRIFPIPAKNDTVTLKGRRQRVMFRYTAPEDRYGFAFPDYTKTQNVKITSATRIRQVMGESSLQLKASDTHARLDGTAARSACQTTGNVREVMMSDSVKARISQYSGNPRTRNILCGKSNDVYDAIRNVSIAIVADVSAYPNGKDVLSQVRSSLAGQTAFLNSNSIDVYKINDIASGPVRLNGNSVPDALSSVRFGSGKIWNALSQIKKSYQAVFILTNTPDISFYSTMYPFSRETTVYFIHSDVWSAYPMALTDAIMQSGGSSARSLDEAMQMFAVRSAVNPSAMHLGSSMMIEYTGLPAWKGIGERLDLPKPVRIQSPSGLGVLVNKGLLDVVTHTYPADLSGNIRQMDETNEFAREAGIVTQYSSSIALVNDQQKQNLEDLQGVYDRYDERIMSEPPRLLSVPITGGGGVFNSGFLSLPQTGVQTIGGSLMMPAPYNGESSIGIARPQVSAVRDIGFGVGQIFRAGGAGGMVVFFIVGNLLLMVSGILYMTLQSWRTTNKNKVTRGIIPK